MYQYKNWKQIVTVLSPSAKEIKYMLRGINHAESIEKRGVMCLTLSALESESKKLKISKEHDLKLSIYSADLNYPVKTIKT